MIDRVLSTIESRRHASLAALQEFLRIPSVSAKPEHAADMQRCATWLADQLIEAGLEVAIMPTGGHPAVVAKNKHESTRPTVLLYGHYDVQPPEPLDLWTTPPFEPSVRKDENGYDAIYARGAVDDKGQVWCHVEAILAWQAHGGLPVNLAVLIEGEEEIGSENLERFVAANKEHLRADICVVSDTGLFDRDTPAITYGLRGLVYEEVFLTGPSHDLHSGGYGGAAPNPANILCEVLASLHNPDSSINLPGFYDDVEPLSAEEKAAWAKLPHDDTTLAAEMGLTALWGEKSFTALERLWSRPTCDINGLTAGYQGHGAKTVIGAKASAKVSMRLVPHQDPVRVRQSFREAIQSRLPANVKVEFASHGCGPAALVPIDNLATRLAAEAMHLGFGKKPTFIRSGGSIPVVGLLKRELDVDTLLVGFGLPDDRVHSPNEKFDMGCFYAGQRTAAALYERLSHLREGAARA
jgi:acetylornithine deacetylase/succinyl-diaminopimelate desuccinylase-like protein